MIEQNTRLIVILGPTASGKTEMAVRLAERFGGEIICADSRTIYQGMSIGTAKPTLSDQVRVPHHLLDIVAPDEIFSAAEFKVQAERIIRDISMRGRTPFLVGGTGLYAYSVVYDYQFPAGPRTAEREKLEQQPLTELVARLWREDPERASEIDLSNPRRVIRAIETVGLPRQKVSSLAPNILLLGIRLSDIELSTKIAQRVKMMMDAGLIGEVEKLLKNYGSTIEVLKSPGYREAVDYLQGATSKQEAEELITLHTRQLVRRQLTWLKRNSAIRWIVGETEDARVMQAERLVGDFLAPRNGIDMNLAEV